MIDEKRKAQIKHRLEDLADRKRFLKRSMIQKMEWCNREMEKIVKELKLIREEFK